jgi:hypothetical protein
MKNFAKSIIRQLTSPSMRFMLKEEAAWLREQLRRACLWKWKIARFALRNESPFDIVYVGRNTRLQDVKLVLGIEDGPYGQRADRSDWTVFVSEFPVPGALFVPVNLGSIIPLGRPIEEIFARYEKNLRHIINNHRGRYRFQQALTDAEIERADREMLRPYAKARYGNSAIQLAPELVRKYARDFGRLDFIMFGNERVGCTLGFENIRAKKRYWISERWGCPETVFSDPKRVSEINTICTYLELERAINNGFDYFDIGASYARPNEGTLQWKKRRGGELDMRAFHKYFYVRLPRMGVAQFLWDAPLFAIERHKLTLHLGLPDGPSDEEVAKRYREMGFGGLFKVYLHCARQPGEHILNKLHGLYSEQKQPPVVAIKPST